MIKLTLPCKPEKLTDELQEQLTTEFKADREKEVWKKSFIKNAVYNITHGKCAYSEVLLGEEGKYMQVEHFYPKSKYPDLVVKWGNLLPSLNHCNSRKKDIDPKDIDIINPLFDNPKDYLSIKIGHLCSINGNLKGKNTIDILDLNNKVIFERAREAIVLSVKETLEDFKQFYLDNLDRFIPRLKSLMRQGGRNEEYAATVATYILSDENYILFEWYLKENKLWDDKFEALKQELEFCALP